MAWFVSYCRSFKAARVGVLGSVGWLGCLGTLALTGCQHTLAPDDRVKASGADLGGWIEDPNALVIVEAYDHCEQNWREVQRAHVTPGVAKLYNLSGYAWQAPLILASATRSQCLVKGKEARVSLRLRERGVDAKFLPNLGEGAWPCLAKQLTAEKADPAMLDACEVHQELSLRVAPSCEPGMVLKTQTIPLAKAGNLRKLADDPDVGQPPIMYHFENSLLVGKGRQVFKYAPEFRNYMLFELPGLPSLQNGGAKKAARRSGAVKSAWISFFVSYATAACGHREDMGCGYASEDPLEDYALSLVSLDPLPDPRGVPYGLQVSDGMPAQALFNAIEQSPVVGRFRMQRADVDRWFQIPLGGEVLKTINAAEPGYTLMLGGRVTSVDRNARKRREWLFVDHLVGKSLGPELEPRLNLAYCAPS